MFVATYQRTTRAVEAAVARGEFEDPGWVGRWDVAFANLYLTTFESQLFRDEEVPRPWRPAFSAAPSLPPLRHVLLGINAHVNYDPPQALLAVISDADFSDPSLMSRRRRDRERIDKGLSPKPSSSRYGRSTFGPLSAIYPFPLN